MTKLLKSSKLTQLINKPTRITHASSALIDLVITNKPNAVLSCNVTPTKVADHDLIDITVNISKPKKLPVVRTFRHLGRYTKENFCLKLLDNVEHFNMILRTDDFDRQVDIFTSNFISCLDACAHYVTKEIKRPFAPWMNTRLQEAMKLRDDIRKQLKFDRYNVALQEHYRLEKKQVKTFIAESKAEHYHNIIHENTGNTAKTWKTIREIVRSVKVLRDIATLMMNK